jgi:hypothetical protein
MTHATAANAGTNEASRELYAACGFTPWHLIDDYVKAVPVRVAALCVSQGALECQRIRSALREAPLIDRTCRLRETTGPCVIGQSVTCEGKP